MKTKFICRSRVWIYPGEGGNWHFISIPKKESVQMREQFGAKARGWGSLPVRATIGETTWETSIFPESKTGVYMLPVKASVRKREALFDRDEVTVTVDVRL